MGLLWFMCTMLFVLFKTLALLWFGSTHINRTPKCRVYLIMWTRLCVFGDYGLLNVQMRKMFSKNQAKIF